MCIFSQPVATVNNTRIFARATSRGTQFLAYQMNYDSRNENAMILPIPIANPAQDDSLRFIDLREYDTFFDDLADGFPYSAPSFNIGCSATFDTASENALEVFEVGNYVASFVPNLSQFSRLDERFTLPETTWLRLPQYADYAFAVFQLAAGSLKPHPMAFEFETGKDFIYFPTVHIHDGEIHQTEDFDHVLYLQHAGLDSRVYGYQNSDVPDKSTGLIRSKYIAQQFCDVARTNGIVDPDLLVHRQFIRGNNVNRDILIETNGDPTKPTLNLRPFFSYTPWLVVVAGVIWFFARRGRIKRLKAAADQDEQRLDNRDRTNG